MCLLTRGFIASTRDFNLPTRTFNLVTCAFSLLTRGFELVTRGFELVTRGFELATRVLLSTIRTMSFFVHFSWWLPDYITMNDIRKVIKKIPSEKPVRGDIPINILKQYDFTYTKLKDRISNAFDTRNFPDCLKMANVAPAQKMLNLLTKRITD